jgi:hypothetical protein
MYKLCIQCGKRYDALRAKQKYCSHDCSIKYRKYRKPLQSPTKDVRKGVNGGN